MPISHTPTLSSLPKEEAWCSNFRYHSITGRRATGDGGPACEEWNLRKMLGWRVRAETLLAMFESEDSLGDVNRVLVLRSAKRRRLASVGHGLPKR